MKFYGPLASAVRAIGRPFTYVNRTPDISKVDVPAVYICRHRNLRGPIFTLLHMPIQLHPWVYSVFCSKQTCYKQYTDYTFSVRLKWHPCTTRMISWLLSRVIPALMKSIGAIPVYRKSFQVKKTFTDTLNCLKRGESIIIYPDVDYVSTDDTPGELYTGFLLVGNLYWKATGKNLQFVPLDIDMNTRNIIVGDQVVFDGAAKFADERCRTAKALKAEMDRIGRQIRSS